MSCNKKLFQYIRFPFNLKQLNKKTFLAMNDTEQKIGKTFNSIDELLQDLSD